jgi:hypothetical protein
MRNFQGNRKIVHYVLAGLLLFCATCNLKLGDSPIGPPVIGPGQQDTTVTFTIKSTPTQLVADGLDTATIEVTYRDNLGHPMAGETVDFTTNNVGSIPSTGVIDQNGVCRVTLTSEQVNDTCWVRAQARNRNIWDSVGVVFGGVHLSLQANPAALRVSVDTTTVTCQLLDGSNRVIRHGDSVVFRTRTGHLVNGDTVVRTQFDAAGQATVRMFSNATGTVMVRASSVTINDSVPVTFDSTTVPVVGSRLFTLYASKSQLKADNYDTATVTAMVMNENHNPATGDTIVFTCNLGMIDSFAVVDINGDAKVTLRARPVNGTCVITATDAQSHDTASTSVIFSGITLILAPSATNLNIGDYASIIAILKDGSGNAIGNDSVVFYTSAPGLFENGSTQMKAYLDPTGRGTVRVTSNSATNIFVSAFCLNTGDTTELFFTNNAITLTAVKDTLLVGGADSTQLIATYLDSSGAAVPNKVVFFYSNAGTITRDSVLTDASGKAYSWLKSASFTGTATVMASTAAGNALVRIAFRAARIKRIKLTVTPDNISINGGVSTLTAMVWDISDNLVNNANVNFRILAGPGGGEYIDKPMATTQNGRATAQLHAGSVPSMYRGVLIAASVADTADTSKLTISGEPYAISVAHPQEDTVAVPKAGHLNERTFDYFMGAVVCDINGNPVADGTRVNFSAVVSGMAVHRKYFVRWEGLAGTDPHAVYGYYGEDVPFEDINNNLRMDENDLKLDYIDAVASRGDDVNGDGRCDFSPYVHDVWFDFNGNGRVDTGLTFFPTIDTTPVTRSIIDTICYDSVCHVISDTTRPDTIWKDTTVTVCREILSLDTIGWTYDTSYSYQYIGCEPYIELGGVMIWADLYPDGVWNTTELIRDVNGNNRFDIPASGDRLWWEYECLPYWYRERFDFTQNDFGVVITTSATTTAGVAEALLTYPRQLARRLIVSVNVESNGVRDRAGARFVLPVIVGN